MMLTTRWLTYLVEWLPSWALFSLQSICIDNFSFIGRQYRTKQLREFSCCLLTDVFSMLPDASFGFSQTVFRFCWTLFIFFSFPVYSFVCSLPPLDSMHTSALYKSFIYLLTLNEAAYRGLYVVFASIHKQPSLSFWRFVNNFCCSFRFYARQYTCIHCVPKKEATKLWAVTLSNLNRL